MAKKLKNLFTPVERLKIYTEIRETYTEEGLCIWLAEYVDIRGIEVAVANNEYLKDVFPEWKKVVKAKLFNTNTERYYYWTFTPGLDPRPKVLDWMIEEVKIEIKKLKKKNK